ncbi:hypothetical protein Tco_0650762 [Tanacetum coccineum]
MKHTEHYRMYAEVFGLDVPLNQSQPTESTQGTHRTPSAPRSPTPKKDTAESSALKQSTVIRFCLHERRSTSLTPPAPVLTVDKADEMILQDTLQEVCNFIDDSLPPKNDEPHIPGTRLEPRSDKESPEVESTNDEEVEITNVVIPVNVNEDRMKITDEVYELKRGVLVHILHVHPAQSQTLSIPEQQYQLYLSMKNDPQLQQQDIAIWLAFNEVKNLQNSAKRQKTYEYEAYVSENHYLDKSNE